MVAQSVQFDNCMAMGILADAITHVLESSYRDYRVERIENILSAHRISGYYLRFGLRRTSASSQKVVIGCISLIPMAPAWWRRAIGSRHEQLSRDLRSLRRELETGRQGHDVDLIDTVSWHHYSDGSYMYMDYFRLSEMPFSIAPDPHFLFMSERHREAIAHLLYGVQGEGGIVLLTGEVGTGKTTVCRRLLDQLPDNIDVAFILNPRMNVRELLQTVCEELDIQVATHGVGS